MNPYMSQADLLGQGFDIYGTYSTSSITRPLLDLHKAPTRTFRFLGVDYELPSIVTGVVDTRSVFNEGAFATRESVQDKFATFAGVQVRSGAFSGQVEVAYSSESQRTDEYSFGFKNLYTRLAYLQLRPDPTYADESFLAAVAALPPTVDANDLAPFASFFQRWGVYFTSRLSLGASFEFYAAVSKSSTDSITQIGAMMQAHYSGLFVTGSVSSSITSTEQWKSYTENSSISLMTTGGDPTAAAHLQAVDVKSPSGRSVDAYNAWLETVSADPAITELNLTGIWELCGDMRDTVQRAWTLYQSRMHPKLSAETSTPPSPTSIATIDIGYPVKPAEPPAHPIGWQVVILDRRTMATPAGVVLDQYFTLDPKDWWGGMPLMYEQIVASIEKSGYADSNHLLVLASFGLEWNCPPSRDFYQLIRSAGGGERLQEWFTTSDPGSRNGMNANYLFCGVFEGGAGSGIEVLERKWRERVDSQLQVYFYRVSANDPFTPGRDPASIAGPTEAPLPETV